MDVQNNYTSLLSATSNTRDLGGYPALNGASPVNNRIWRSDAPTDRNEADERLLTERGITTIIDLRTGWEAEKKPCAYAGAEGFEYHHVPVSAGSVPPASLEEVPYSYLEIAMQAAQVFRMIAEADSGVLVCCTAGKDRTGVISALLLLACGVDRRYVVEDYAVSREYNRTRLEQYLSEHPELDRRIVLANEASMERFIDLIYERFGSVQEYFGQSGLTAAQFSRIRGKLLAAGGA